MKNSAQYILNNNGKKLLAASVLALLLAGAAQPVWAADLDGTANGKLAQVSSGDVYGHVYGVTDGSTDPGTWKQTDALAEGGTINMQGGEAFNMYGGTAYVLASKKAAAAANNNAVNITGGKTDIAVYGGVAQGYSAEASGNSVNISGGETGMDEKMIPYAVIGGWANALGSDGNAKAAADNNVVTITGGVVNNGVYGAYAQGVHTGQFNADGNTVSIGGDAKVKGDIYGAYISVRDSATGEAVPSAEADNNRVIISGRADLAEARLHGSNAGGSGNALVINGWHGKVESLGRFNLISFNDVEWHNHDTVVNVADGAHSDLASTVIDAGHIHFTGGSDMNAKDSMVLIHLDGAEEELSKSVIKSGDFTAGVALEGSGEAKLENGDLVYEINGLHTAKQVNLVAENRAVAAAFVNQGTDLISDSLDALSRDDGYGVKTFAAVHGNSSKYDVNSDIKINGWSTIAGFGAKNAHNGGDFSWGVFYENGTGNYRTYNEFNNEFFRGDGSLVYNGGGVAARYENAHGVYTEGSLRAGMLKSEMDGALRDGSGTDYGYESDSAYYGAHIGVGQIIKLNDSTDLDVYGKFFHTYTEGGSFNVAGDEFAFDGINSDRLRIGARVTANKDNRFSTYYGLAYEYEFNGDSAMRAAGRSLPEQSLQGSSYIAEIGLNYQPAPDSPWSFDMSVRGYAGEREGGSFNVQATYTF